jgi:hypothetical protein
MFMTCARIIATIAATGLVITLTACGTPPWADPSLAPNAHESSSASASRPATITPIANDLASGSAKRTLTAGDITLTVNYWSDLAMNKWTTQANKPLSISATATVGTDAGQAVYLSKLTITPSVSGGGKTLPTPAVLSDPASVSPGYAIKSPYSYTQTFTLPPLDKRVRSIALTLDYELLLQTTPTSDAYAKQSVSDSLTIAIRP